MKMHYLAILKNDVKPSPELCAEFNDTGLGYFTKGTVKTFATYFSVEVVANKIPLNQDLAVTEPDQSGVVVYGHAVRGDICAIAITDEEYPDRVALALCRKIANEFTAKYPRTAYANAKVGGPHMSFPELKGYLDKYQRPEEADNIAKIQKELDETKATVLQTLESLLERGEKIENLVAKSEGLSVQSKMFFSQAKKQNSCCNVM